MAPTIWLLCGLGVCATSKCRTVVWVHMPVTHINIVSRLSKHAHHWVLGPDLAMWVPLVSSHKVSKSCVPLVNTNIYWGGSKHPGCS